MFSLSSWSPPLIHILLPVIAVGPVGLRLGPRRDVGQLLPACGSDRHIVP